MGRHVQTSLTSSLLLPGRPGDFLCRILSTGEGGTSETEFQVQGQRYMGMRHSSVPRKGAGQSLPEGRGGEVESSAHHSHVTQWPSPGTTVLGNLALHSNGHRPAPISAFISGLSGSSLLCLWP